MLRFLDTLLMMTDLVTKITLTRVKLRLLLYDMPVVILQLFLEYN
jgi:hypothetical protein